mgnify:CR=1 FL=1
MKKRNLIALLMAVCMMFSLLPVNAIAVGDEGTVPAEETLLSENGNDSVPAGSTNPAGDKDSIPDTGEKPSAAEEPVKDEESGKDEEPAKGEEDSETNVVPMRVVRPDTDKYLTYLCLSGRRRGSLAPDRQEGRHALSARFPREGRL